MISRRKFLVAAVTVTASTVAAYIAKPHLRQLILPKLDTTYPLGVLREMEMRNIIALGETLIAPGPTPPVNFFLDYVNAVTQSQPGFLKEYQSAASLLNATSEDLFGQGSQLYFADLPVPRRDKVLQTQLWRYSGIDRIVPKIEKLAASRNALALRIYVMSPLIEHYYRSPFGWAIVGYESFPGQPPIDPRAYTSPPDGKSAA